MAALVWLIAGVLLVAGEVLSGNFVLLMLGAGALAASGADVLGGALPLDVAVFALTSIALIGIVRPMLTRRLSSAPHTKTNVEALVGGRATVLSTVDAHGGRVKIGGEVWSARAYDETQVLEPGRSVTVMDISGATAIVWGDF